jgi:hypothetical protein
MYSSGTAAVPDRATSGVDTLGPVHDEATVATTSTSLWLDQLDGQVGSRPRLDGDRDVDVAIVGAGYSGLWSAHALLRADPSLRVLVIEREVVGFGASGRTVAGVSANSPEASAGRSPRGAVMPACR